MVLVLLTTVDLRRAIMYAAWPANICLESTSLPPKGLLNILLISITIFISSYLHFSFKMQVVRRSPSLSITKYYVTKKSLQCFDQRISRAFPGNLHIFNFRLSKQEERMNKNKPKRNSCADQKSAEIKLTPFSVGKLLSLHAFSSW